MIFLSEAHQQRFLAVMQQIGKLDDDSGRLDQEYGAALYLLTARAGLWWKAQAFVTPDGIDIPTMLADVALSGGQSVLVRLAGNLFNNEVHLDPIDLMRLDESNFRVALIALQLRRSSVPLTDVRRA